MYLLCRGVTFLHVLHVQCAEREREGTTGAGAALKNLRNAGGKPPLGLWMLVWAAVISTMYGGWQVP